MTTAIEKTGILEQHLIIESITLVDGVTLDEQVQYKVGREILRIKGSGIGERACVAYYDNRSWVTYALTDVSIDEEKVVLTDRQSIYTFKRKA